MYYRSVCGQQTKKRGFCSSIRFGYFLDNLKNCLGVTITTITIRFYLVFKQMLLAYKYVTATKSKYAENNGMSRTIRDPTDLVPRVASKFRIRRKKNNSLKY